MEIRIACVLLCAMLAVPAVTSAQSNAEGTQNIQFDFLNPGARSMAMGGAFVAVADDATAALANPAGLQQLNRSEFSIEFRRRGFTTLFADAGRASGAPDREGLDIATSLSFDEVTDHVSNLSFISFAYVPNRRAAITAYRHETVRFSSNFRTQGFFFDDEDGGTSRRRPIDASTRLNVYDYGVAGSLKVWEACRQVNQARVCDPRLTIGAGLSIYNLKIDASVLRYDIDDDLPAAVFNQRFYGDRSLWTPNANEQTTTGWDGELAYKAGLLYTPSAKFSVGAVIKMNPEFDVTLTDEIFPQGGFSGLVSSASGTFVLPDVIAGGVTVRPHSRFNLAFDVVRVYYGDQAPSLRNLNGGFFEEGFELLNEETEEWQIPEVWEFHLGGEFKLAPKSRFVPVFRAGVWHDPEHALQWQPTEADAALDSNYFIFGPGGQRPEDAMHYTIGGGFLVRGVEVNAAGDFSKRGNIGSLSAVYRFGR